MILVLESTLPSASSTNHFLAARERVLIVFLGASQILWLRPDHCKKMKPVAPGSGEFTILLPTPQKLPFFHSKMVSPLSVKY